MNKMKDLNGAVIVWIDYMKMGRLTGQDLNWTVELCKKALASMPDRACCFAIAPQLVSERRSGLRAECRRQWDILGKNVFPNIHCLIHR